MFTKHISRQDREVREVSFWGLLCGLSVLCVRQIKHSRLDLSMPCNHKTAPGQIQPSRGSLAVERKFSRVEVEKCRILICSTWTNWLFTPITKRDGELP